MLNSGNVGHAKIFELTYPSQNKFESKTDFKMRFSFSN